MENIFEITNEEKMLLENALYYTVYYSDFC